MAMEDSGAILCQISSLKDMLDQVNEEIETNIQITREIESEIVKCSETETALAVQEAELTKSLYAGQFELKGLVAVTVESRNSMNYLEDEIQRFRTKRDEIVKRISNKREGFMRLCLEFQNGIGKESSDEIMTLLTEREFLEEEIGLFSEKKISLAHSSPTFEDGILEDLHDSNMALHIEIQNGLRENERALRDIDALKSVLL